jgi:hypothetical protein
MLAVPLLPETERVEPLRAIHREDPIEMIDLMLEELGPIAVQVDFVPRALEVLVAHPDPIGSRDANQ